MNRIWPGEEGERSEPRELRIAEDLAGERLDRALAPLAPGGLRGRRRRIAEGGVLLNGVVCQNAGRRVMAGDVLALASSAAGPGSPAGARLLCRGGDFCFLFKDAGLHCAALAGKGGDSLERRLAGLCAPVLEQGEKPELLQRLDRGTSGIVCAALKGEAARAFRAAEAAGHCEKHYLALLTGRLDAPVTARHPLDTAHRRTTRLLAGEAGPLRQTDFVPLHVWEGETCARLRALTEAPRAAAPLTLAACRIRLGARHQIRAHAAALGHPLLGDTQYSSGGREPKEAPPRFFLHHGFLRWPQGRCSAPPPWAWLGKSLPPEARLAVRAWLEIAD